MNDKSDKLEKKIEQDSEVYRLNKLLDIILQADLRRLDEICAKMVKKEPEEKLK